MAARCTIFIFAEQGVMELGRVKRIAHPNFPPDISVKKWKRTKATTAKSETIKSHPKLDCGGTNALTRLLMGPDSSFHGLRVKSDEVTKFYHVSYF